MTVSSGFFNSVNHDRLYDAEQLSSIFDGIIIDGVYENYGEAFMVKANPDANSSVIIGTGRAWFDHTWTVNDSQFAMQLDPPNGLVERRDAIVIDVDRTTDVRKNTIKYIAGPLDGTYPELVKETRHTQYPIAYVIRKPGEPIPIEQKDIEITVGGGECPIATGVLDAQNLENLWQQLDDEFNTWWEGIKDTLDENAVTNIINRIEALESAISGGNAMVGLLEKAIADKFATGNYGLSIKSFTYNGYTEGDTADSVKDSGTSGISENKKNYDFLTDPDPIVALLPDKKVLMVFWPTDYRPGSGHSYTHHYLWVEIRDTNGVGTANYDTGSRAGVVFLGASVNTYPARVYLGVQGRYKAGTASAEAPSFFVVTLTIYSDGSISLDQGANVHGTVSSYDVQYWSNAVRRSDGTKYVVMSYARNTLYGNDKGYCIRIKDNYSIDPLVESNKFPFTNEYINGLYTRLFDYNGKLCACIPSQNFPTCWCYVDYDTLISEGYDSYYTNGNEYPNDWSVTPYEASYPSEVYTLSEQNGVQALTVEAGASSDGETVKISNYFCGASNLGGSLPEGPYVAIKDTSDRLWGIGPNGENIAIGTNGGAAILKKKNSGTTINFDKNVKWLRGYVSDDSGAAYLFADRTYTDLGIYHLDSGLEQNYFSGASVIYINKED